MSTTTRISTAERLGRSFGRGWRAYVRGERRASNWLVSKGVPVAGATVLLWLVKLVVLGVLLYSAFWLALLLVCVVAVGFNFNTKVKNNLGSSPHPTSNPTCCAWTFNSALRSKT